VYISFFAGGGCKICGSVEHFRRNCPELAKQTKGNNLNYTNAFVDTACLKVHVYVCLEMAMPYLRWHGRIFA